LPENASRGKNVLQALKKVSLTPMDQINQQTVAAYVQEAIWLGNKMLPKNWSKWRYDKKTFVSDDTKKGSITCGCGWKVILGGNASRIHKQQVLLSKGKLQTRVVSAVSR
jgi:hypothetical protein